MTKQILLVLAAVAGVAQAQTSPDAGALQQQFDRERRIELPRPAPANQVEPAVLKPNAGLSIEVKEFRFTGNASLSAAQLTAAVTRYQGRSLGFDELQAAAAAVAQAYRDAGWVVRAFLPEQDIRDGIVTIQVVESVFGELRFDMDSGPTRVSVERLRSSFQGQQASGLPLNTNALDRALLLTDDLPGVTVAGSLVPGARAGQTDLVLRARDENLFIGDLLADNTGARSTGANRVVANVVANSPLGLGDQLYATGLKSEGSDYLRASYTLPVGYDGWRVGANASHLKYKVVLDELPGIKGTSSVTGLEASYPLLRGRLQNLYLALNYDHKRFDNSVSGTSTSNYVSDGVTLGLSGNAFDKLGGGGVNSASVALVRGRLNLAGSANEAGDAASTRAQGHFTKARYQVGRQQLVTDDLSLTARLSGQLANRNLDSSEKFYLGGASGVRAYPSSEGGGADGRMVNIELRQTLPEGFALTGFYDWGQVSINHDNGFAGAAALNTYSLQGWGLSLGWQSASSLSLKASWARRIGHNPNPTSTGADQDGSRVRDRFWLSASISF